MPSSQPSTIPPSAAYYTGILLAIYDFWVLQLSSSYAWCCSTRDVLLPLFQRHIGAQAHMEIGVGSAYYLAASARQLSEVERLALVDLNQDALQHAQRRLRRAGYNRPVETLHHDVFTPFPTAMHAQFDSVSIFYVLHCLPGKFPEKADKVFSQVKPVLKSDGLVYGTTIMGYGQGHNWFGRCLMAFYNWNGIFANTEDTMEGLGEAVRKHFAEVEVLEMVGRVAVFVAKKPIQTSG